MAIQTGIFKTPTGPIYAPAKDIERGFEKTTGIVTDFLQRKATDYDQQQAMFGELANKIGEIDADLEQNYAGMGQEAIDKTTEFVKEAIKSKTRVNDPEFQMEFGRRIGAIRNAMGNANKIRSQIDLEIKQIEANPYMDFNGKNAAVSELLSMAYNPDVLIDKDPLQKLTSVSKKYVDPYLIGREAYNRRTSKGTKEDLYIDQKGNQVSRKIGLNDLTDPNDLLDEFGNVKLKNLTTQVADEIISNDPQLFDLVERERMRLFPNENQSEARRKVLETIMTPAANAQRTEEVFRTGRQLEMEGLQMEGAKEGLKLTRAQVQDMYAKTESRKKFDDFAKQENADYNRFYNLFEKGSNEALSPYLKGMGIMGYKNVQWDKNIPYSNEGQAATFADWKERSDEEKIAFIKGAGIDPDRLKAYTKKGTPQQKEVPLDLESEATFKLFDERRKQNADVVGITYRDKDGNLIKAPFDEFGGVSGLYEALRTGRYSGKNYIPIGQSQAQSQAQSGGIDYSNK